MVFLLDGDVIEIECLGYSQPVYFVLEDNHGKLHSEYITIHALIKNEIVGYSSSELCVTKCKTVCRLFESGLCDSDTCGIKKKFTNNEKSIYYPGEDIYISGINRNLRVFGIYYKPFISIISSIREFSINEVRRNILYSTKSNVDIQYIEYLDESNNLKKLYNKENFDKITNVCYLVREKTATEFNLGNRELYTIVQATFTGFSSNPNIIPRAHVTEMNICERCIFKDCLTCKVKLYV